MELESDQATRSTNLKKIKGMGKHVQWYLTSRKSQNVGQNNLVFSVNLIASSEKDNWLVIKEIY